MRLYELFDDFLRLFFPETCAVCHRTLVRGEEILCLECSAKIPETNYHLRPLQNPLHEKIVDTRIPVERALAYFHYKKDNPYSQLIRNAKYSNRPVIDLILARNYALSILPSGCLDGIDGIVPVPCHWIKHLRRGYNQTHYIASGIAEVTDIPILPILKARRPHKTQTHKSATNRRHLPLNSIFTVDPETLSTFLQSVPGASPSGDEQSSTFLQSVPEASPSGDEQSSTFLQSVPGASASGEQTSKSAPHLLLVDDVITTGSTILACAHALHQAIPGLRLSVLSLATTALE